MRLSILGSVAAAALLIAGAASAQTVNATVLQNNAAPQVSVTNVNRIAGVNVDIAATSVGNNLSAEGNHEVNVGGPGWVSATTGVGGQTNSADVSATVNVDRVLLGKGTSAAQAIANNTEVDAGHLANVNTTLSQRTANVDVAASSNLNRVLVAGKFSGESLAVGNNLSVTAGHMANIGGSSTADLQINRGSNINATLNFSDSYIGGAADLSAQAVSNNLSVSASNINATFGQTTGIGDPWPVADIALSYANLNVNSAIFDGKTSLSSSAIGSNASLTGSNVNLNASQLNIGAAQSAVTNVSLSAFGGVSSIAASAVGNSISVRSPL